MKNKKHSKQRFLINIMYFGVLFLLSGNFQPANVCAETVYNEENKIKVGFFAREGYHIEEEGSRSGYGYEVLQLMARYSDEIYYEYIGYEKSRAEAFEMLYNDEVDLLTSAHGSSKEKEGLILSNTDIGTCSTMLTVKAGNISIESGNYETYEGIRVGLVADDVHDVCFHDFAANNKFSYIPVYYNTVADVVEALVSGEIDVAATSSVRVLDENEWYLEAFHEEKLYVVVGEENAELMEIVNEALRKLDLNEPDWRIKLQEKYFPKDEGELLNLNKDELVYLNEIKENREVFQVLVNPDRYPYSYIEDGEYKGIMVDVFANLAEKAKIKYKYIMVTDRKEYVDVLMSGVPDICIDCSDDFSTAENQGYQITDPYLKVNYSWLYRSDHTGVIKKGARLSYSSVKDSVRDTFGDIEYVDYLYDEEAIEAVRNGEVEGYSTNTLNAEKIMWEDEKNELQARVRANPLNFTIGTAFHTDNRLLTILNKAVRNMDESLVEEIKSEYAYLGEKEYTFFRLINEYPWIMLMLLVSVVIILLFIFHFNLQKKYSRKILQEAESAKKANEAKNEFISRMSHDIRTPINGIVGMIEVARRNINDKEKVMDCLVKMFVASKQLEMLVNDVLNMTEMVSEQEDVKENKFDIREQLDYCIDVINGRIYGRNLTFEYDYTKIQHPYLIGSEVRLNEIIINILGNSVKYTKDGGKIWFVVEEKETKEDGKAAFCFHMEDTGIGMSKEFVDKIFEPFTQESTSSRSSYEGTGLGMTIVKKLLDKMGGTIDIESLPGLGSKFDIHLTFKIDKEKEIEIATKLETETETETEQTVEETQEDDLTGATVLVVDDIELNIDILQSILEDEGVTVLTASNGLEAIDVFGASEIGSMDLILMDIRMPVLDGIEATKAIRSMDRADAKSICIMAVSANAREADAEKSQEAGMNGHMNKPVEVDELLKLVATCKKK